VPLSDPPAYVIRCVWTCCALCACGVGQFNGMFRSGFVNLALWHGDCPSPTATTLDSRHHDPAGTLEMEFESFSARSVVFTSYGELPTPDLLKSVQLSKRPLPAELEVGLARFTSCAQCGPCVCALAPLVCVNNELCVPAPPQPPQDIMLFDPLAEMTEGHKDTLWRHRYLLCHYPEAITKFLRSIDWAKSASVREAHQLLHLWTPPGPLEALQVRVRLFVRILFCVWLCVHAGVCPALCVRMHVRLCMRGWGQAA
jgi:hypothetical protein